jgi:hypothetical protein
MSRLFREFAMRTVPFLAFLLPVALLAQAPASKPKAAPEAASEKARAELKVGTGVEKMELTGEAADFKVPAGTKIFAWTKVWGAGDTATVVFSKGDKSTKIELKVPHSPYRTHAFKTFRAGDDGDWTVKVLGADGTELGTASFKVEIQGEAAK